MAKKTTEKAVNAAPARADTLSGDEALAFARNETPAKPSEETVQEEDVGALFLSRPDALAALDKVTNAKVDDFEEMENDFIKWKECDDGFTLQGIYLGSNSAGRYTQHAVGTKDAKGRPSVKRFNGTMDLRKKLTDDKRGKGVRITLSLVKGVDKGTFHEFDVRWL